jgi:hypothetical protein
LTRRTIAGTDWNLYIATPEFRPVDGRPVARLRTLLTAQALRNSPEK